MKQPGKILFIIALLYLVHSQVAPYLHFHSHDHHIEHEIVFCAQEQESETNNKLCCKEHHKGHELVEADWNYISNSKKLKVYISIACIAMLPRIEVDKPKINTAHIVLSQVLLLDNIFPKHFNKAPPYIA